MSMSQTAALWKLRFKEIAMFQNKRTDPKEIRKLDHRKASRDFHFEMGYSLVIQNCQSNEKSRVSFSLALGESGGSTEDLSY